MQVFSAIHRAMSFFGNIKEEPGAELADALDSKSNALLFLKLAHRYSSKYAVYLAGRPGKSPVHQDETSADVGGICLRRIRCPPK